MFTQNYENHSHAQQIKPEGFKKRVNDRNLMSDRSVMGKEH